MFYADESLFHSEEAYGETETLGYYSSWHDPSEAKFSSLLGTKVEQQRDIEVQFDLPPNPFLKHGTAQKHYLLLRKTETEMDIAVRVTQSGFPYADAGEMV